MKNKIILTVLFCLIIFTGFNYWKATNFDYLVLGEVNFGTDPNPGKDITGQNDDWISNDGAGTWSVGDNLDVGGNITADGEFTTLAMAFTASDTATVNATGDTATIPNGGSNILVIDAADGDSIKAFVGGDPNKIYYIEFVEATVSLIDGNNLKLSGDLDFTNVSDRAVMYKRGANWYLLGFSNND